VRSAYSYASANDLRVHFGLGAATHAERITIRWPSGRREERVNVAGDQIVRIIEGRSRGRIEPARHSGHAGGAAADPLPRSAIPPDRGQTPPHSRYHGEEVPEPIVSVRAVGVKRRDRVEVGGKIFEL
jgi:hypothetical protein